MGNISLEAILYYLVLFDALSVNIVAWLGIGKAVFNRSSVFQCIFPITRGWTTYYLLIVLWLGYALARIGVIG